MNARIKAICVSTERGGPKHAVAGARLVRGFGIEGDGHGGSWHRQISLLASGAIRIMEEKGLDLAPGAFGENLVVDAPHLEDLYVGKRLRIGERAVIQVTQRGKECHTRCVIFEQVGDCIMPRDGLFARVLRSGALRPGDVLADDAALDTVRYAVITLSDRSAAGRREDTAGDTASRLLADHIAGAEIHRSILPDDRRRLAETLVRLAEEELADLIVTTGGTGLSPRDVTPEATREVIDREIPGLAEEIRRCGLAHTPHAMLSRGVCGMRGSTIIVNLAGSPKAVAEQLGSILPALPHALAVATGIPQDCAR